MCASPRGAPAAILAVPPRHIDAHANLRGGCLQRFCRRRNYFVRHCSRVNIFRRFPTQNRAPGLFEGRKFWRVAREGRFDIRQLVYSSSDHWRRTYRNDLLESARSTRSVSGSTTQQQRRGARANMLVSRFLTVTPENPEITALDQSHQDCRS